LMQAAELALPALGYVLENRHLGHVLLHALRQHPRIHCVDNTHIQQLHFTADAVHLHTDHTAYAAALAVIAEKPEMFGRTLIYMGLAEGIAIYGLVMSILLLGKL